MCRISTVTRVIPLALWLVYPGLAVSETEDEAFLRWQTQQAANIEAPALTDVAPANTAPEKTLENSGGDMSRQNFEKLLGKQYYGSFLFYNRLSEQSKQTAYDKYQQTGDMKATRDTIMKLFSRR